MILTLRISKLKLDRLILQGQIKAARELAKSLPEVIKDRVRSGQGLNGALQSLSTSYVKFRERYRRRLSKFTDPGASNLTATGQMLNAIKGIASRTLIRISITGTRKKELSGSSSKLSNNKVREYVEKDRPFFELTDNERKLAEEIATDIIKKELRKAFK